MPKVKYHVRLSKEERAILLGIISKGAASARSIMRTNVLLAAVLKFLFQNINFGIQFIQGKLIHHHKAG